MDDKNGMKHKAEGTWDKVKGHTKDAVGDMTDDASMQAEGKWDKVKGEAKQEYGEAKDRLNDDDDRL